MKTNLDEINRNIYDIKNKDELFDKRVSYDATTANYRIYRNNPHDLPMNNKK